MRKIVININQAADLGNIQIDINLDKIENGKGKIAEPEIREDAKPEDDGQYEVIFDDEDSNKAVKEQDDEMTVNEYLFPENEDCLGDESFTPGSKEKETEHSKLSPEEEEEVYKKHMRLYDEH